jgi:hypothetical protein
MITHFRHKGLRQLHEGRECQGRTVRDGRQAAQAPVRARNRRGSGAGRPVSRLEVASPERRPERIMELDSFGKLAVDFRYDEATNTASDIDLIDYH